MNRTSSRITFFSTVMALLGWAFFAGCGGAIVHTRADAALLVPKVGAVVSLPPRLGFGKAGIERRAARRTSDTLIEATGGHAILDDELPSTDPELIADGVRGLGEDPEQTLTFTVIAARSERIEAVVVPGMVSRIRPTHRLHDYMVRLDVRRADRPDLIGSIETFTTVLASAPEIDNQGKPLGLQRAIDDAVHQALKTFAPNLVPGQPFPTVVEVPTRHQEAAIAGALGAVDKLRRLQVLYPELSADDLAALASSNARFLIVKAGRLASLGLRSGDLVSGMGGRTLGGRAALARTLARGDVPAMSIDRGGGRFLIGQTLVARAH
jgi:hypothetical protein